LEHDTEEQNVIAEQFILDRQAQGLSEEELIVISARVMVAAINASGRHYAKVDIENLGTVEVELDV
ncbi:hypothetical protein, partial [Vibrio paucivorans]